MTAIALDTNIAVDVLNDKLAALHLLAQFEIICLPITGSGELLFGAKNSAQRLRNEPRYQAFISTCILLETNALVAETYAEIRLQLKKAGRPISENDIWIAAACLSYDVPLFSHDQHFDYVVGLRVQRIS